MLYLLESKSCCTHSPYLFPWIFLTIISIVYKVNIDVY